MSKYIDAVKAAKIVSERHKIPLSELVDIFTEVPTADVIEVVRCEKCKYYVCKNGRDMCKRNAVYYECSRVYMGLVAIGGRTHFCGYGARMDEEVVKK